jgi:hypothetical protein
MPVMTDRQSVAANATVTNVLAGKLHEFLNRPSAVRLYACASAVGLNSTLIVGSQSSVQDQEVNAQNRLPIVPDDFLAEAGGLAGERILVSYRNTTGAAITAFTRVEVEPVA